ncbi:uncharacterized protein [Macrobrachium rosenbergii]|uniref:uncharacterized protein isoform X2 n=1 Tax=Macrobrachium rosenbergii TaxID=79674 RepID=UPI0034D44953
MWTLQRPNKDPDKKWRLNKESKYSSLLRPGSKKNKENEARDTTVINYRTVDRLHDRISDRFIDPRADPRLLVDPRVDHRIMDPRYIEHHRLMMDPRLGSMDPRLLPPPRILDLDQEVECKNEPRIEPEYKPRVEPPDFKARLEAARVEPRLEARVETRLETRVEPRLESRLEPRANGVVSGGVGGEGDPKVRLEAKLESPPREVRLRDGSKDRGDLRERLERMEARMSRYEPDGRDRFVERYVEQVSREREQESCGPAPTVEMVSRRRILGRSQDNLNVDLPYMEDEDDVWYKTEKLLKDHITEVLMKWEQIDDEIWAKVIVLESNRRVAKAYARVPVLTVNGSDDGFDGYRIGLCGFENPMRDPRTDEVKRHIGQGVKLKMDDQGNILIKRVSKAGVYVKITSDDNAISNEILKLPNCCLESERPVMLFDMNKFQQNVNREMRRQYPDRSKLELQCVCVIAFVKNESDLLDCPIWVMIINIVAMDMLKSKLPPAKVAPNIRNRPRIPIPDEDPYSVAGSGASSGSSGKDRKDKPPKLPPRDNPHYPPGHVPRSNGKSDYDVLDENAFRKSHTRNNKSKDRKYDDPYYCGLRAHIPNFAKAKSKGKVEPARAPYLNAPPPPMWHTRSFDSGMALLQHNQAQNIHRLDRNPCSWVPTLPARNDSDFTESPYSQLYGRLPLPNRAFMPPPPLHPRSMYVGDWN